MSEYSATITPGATEACIRIFTGPDQIEIDVLTYAPDDDEGVALANARAVLDASPYRVVDEWTEDDVRCFTVRRGRES